MAANRVQDSQEWEMRDQGNFSGMDHLTYTYADICAVIRLFNDIGIVCPYVKSFLNIVKNNKWKCCWSHVKWYVLGDEVLKESCRLLIYTEIRAFADTVSLIPDNTNDAWCEWFVLPQLVKATINLVKGLNIANDDLIL